MTELTGEEKELTAQLSSYEEKFDAAMDDDLNTADALAAIFELVRICQFSCRGRIASKAFLRALKEKIVSLADVLGVIVEKKEEMLDADIEALIEERQAARKAKNFARADEIRNELLSKGHRAGRYPGRCQMEKSVMDLPESLKMQFGGEIADIRTYSPLALAYIGDGDLRSGDPDPDRASWQLRRPNKLHKSIPVPW